MPVTYFSSRRNGPECLIEDAVATQLSTLFWCHDSSFWTVGSLPVGAGKPDLLSVSSLPEVVALADATAPTVRVLAVLRTVGKIRPETIADRLGKSPNVIQGCIANLLACDALIRDCNSYRLAAPWRHILPNIVTVEAKVANWKQALLQARRNQLFAHQSFVALPERVAKRVYKEPDFGRFGIGVLSVDDEKDVTILCNSTRHSPKVWLYYYQVASLVAKHKQEEIDALQCRSC